MLLLSREIKGDLYYTAFYKKCADKQTKKCSYFNLFSTYGYVTIGGQGSDDKYHKFNYNNRNGNSYYINSNNKNYLNQRNHNYHKENNLYQKNKYNDNKGDYLNKKYYK